MPGKWSSALVAVTLAGVLLCGCGGRDERHGASSATRTAVENPSDFPLYPNSALVTVVPIDSAQIVAAIRANDPHAEVSRGFHGHEVIAQTSATLTQLSGWIGHLKNSPPAGFHVMPHDAGLHVHVTTGTGPATEVAAQFATRDGAREVYLVAADPRRIREQLGPAFALIDSYSAVPGVLRGPIDDQAKQQFGYTVTEMLDAKSPVGAVVAALKSLADTDRRAILLIDETKSK